jgi:hypothetical protein
MESAFPSSFPAVPCRIAHRIFQRRRARLETHVRLRFGQPSQEVVERLLMLSMSKVATFNKSLSAAVI